jgi:hypothetical protein
MARLKEGTEYKFNVEKELQMPDGSEYFVVTGPDNKKYLLPHARYSDYGIKARTEIYCTVDRINCKGEVFLEPRNPWYTEGKKYPFIVDSIEDRTDFRGTKQDIIVVLDRCGNRINVLPDPSEPLPAKGIVLNLVVEKISKGKVYLIKTSRAIDDPNFKPRKVYSFKIEGIAKGLDDEEYYIISDQFGNRHTLTKHYYEYYGFGIHSTFRGRIVKFNKNGERTIEPENPFYKPGDRLEMKITNCTENTIDKSYTLDLLDEFGHKHCISSGAAPEKKTVVCRVIMIRKGRPLFKVL